MKITLEIKAVDGVSEALEQKVWERFIGWFLDGGGEQEFSMSLEMRNDLPNGEWINSDWGNDTNWNPLILEIHPREE